MSDNYTGRVRLGMFKLESWLKTGTLKKDFKCKKCKKFYADIGEDISFVQEDGHAPEQRCKPCAESLIAGGWEDLNIKIASVRDKREAIERFIVDNSNYVLKGSYNGWNDINGKTIEQLEKIKEDIEAKLEKERLIQEDVDKYVDVPTADYLFEDYSLHEDKEDLRSPLQIEDYFKDIGRDFFECGQGYSQNEAEVLCKIGDMFYNVEITAEILSQKQDVGDRLYWVENITSVKYYAITEPMAKPKITWPYLFNINDDEKRNLDNFLKENNIKYMEV